MNTHKKMINRTAVALVALWAGLLYTQAVACPPPPCLPCWSNWPACDVWNCSSEQVCCNKSCCTNACCDGLCYNSSTQRCCWYDGQYYVCPIDEYCCESECYDPQTEQCCWYGDGTKCDLTSNEECCEGDCCVICCNNVCEEGVSSIQVDREAICWSDPNGFTFTALPGEHNCIQWQSRYKASENDAWSDWFHLWGVNDNPLNYVPYQTGYWQFRARNTHKDSWAYSPEVVSLSVVVNLSESWACDGVRVDIDLTVTPECGKNHITGVDFDAVEPDGVTNYGNPSGEGLTFSQRGDITQWQIDNTRWYSTQQDDHCNQNSEWRITATYSVGSSHCTTNTENYSASSEFGDSQSDPRCLWGAAWPIQIFSGLPDFSTSYNQQTSLWETTVSQGSFIRDVVADYDWKVEPDSQYHDMVRDEEIYHAVQQMMNPNHIRWGTAFLAENIMNDVYANQPYIHSNQTQSRQLAENAFQTARQAEIARSSSYLNQDHIICADEYEAKGAVGSSYRVDMPCAYSWCP